MKRICSALLCLFLVVCLLPLGARAEDTSRDYDFALTADGNTTVNATPGQILTVTLMLNRMDSQENADMYAVQAELLYDHTFLELVDSSVMTASSVEWTDMARRTGGRAFYLNFLSRSGGESWPAKVQLGSFQMKVLGESGTSTIRSENCIVSVQDGSQGFASTCNNVTVVVSTECTVRFESGGGSAVPDQTVQYGERVTEPQEPTREGYRFNGWYADLDRTRLWDFENDTVSGNMTLYAGWLEGADAEGDSGNQGGFGWLWLILGLLALLAALLLLLLLFGKKKVTFDSQGGTELEPVSVKKGDKLQRPMTPVRTGCMFLGWYTQDQGGKLWDFENDTVEKSMTLYAHWR